MDYKFKIGDKVRIRKDSRYYSVKDVHNPNIPGIIIYVSNISSGLYIKVKWDNEKENSYRVEDLELIDIKTELYSILTDENISIKLESLEDRKRLYQLYKLLYFNFYTYTVNNITYTLFDKHAEKYIEVLVPTVKDKTIIKFKDLMKQLKDKYNDRLC